MKKTTAIVFILFASMLLLAHAVIPHHHHDTEVCFKNDHCQAGCSDHNDDANEHKHEHDGDDSSESCILKTDVVVTSKQLKQERKWFSRVDIDAGFDTFQSTLFSSGYFHQRSPNYSRPPIPLIATKYSCFVGSSAGLRAPPIV